MNIPSPLRNTTTMKPPNVCSIPRLHEIDPFAEFEFSFPCEDMWWDESDTSDYFSCDEDSSATSDYEESFTTTTPAMFDISFPSEFYSLSPIPFPNPESDLKEKDVLIQKIISTLSHVAPTSVYRRRKFSTKRKRHRKKRKKLTMSQIEPELRTLWLNYDIVGVLPATDPMLSPPSTLPTINLSNINKLMLKRLPDVKEYPVHSASNDPAFYECTKLLQAPFGGKNHLVHCRRYKPTLAQYHLPQKRVSATCGQKERGQSRLSSPLFQEIQGEDSGGEEKSEADMSEERNAEGGEIKNYVRDKNNCTTLETSLVISITYVSPNIVMSHAMLQYYAAPLLKPRS